MWLRGQVCTRVHAHYPGNFTFELSGGRAAIDCAWRIVRGGRVALSHSDHGQRFGHQENVDASREAAALLSGRAVIGGRIDTALGDVVLEFEGGVRLEVFNDAGGYEGWTMTGPDGTTLLAASGGEVSSFAPEA
jgi:Family of unknown function (DUF6188)